MQIPNLKRSTRIISGPEEDDFTISRKIPEAKNLVTLTLWPLLKYVNNGFYIKRPGAQDI